MVAHAFVHDSGTHLKVFPSIHPQDANAGTVTGDSFDRRLYYSGKVVIVTGATDSGDFSATATIEHSDDDATWEAAPNTESVSITAADSVVEADIQTSELKQYARVVIEVVFNDAGSQANLAAFFVGAAGQHLPAGLDVTTTSVNVNQ